jgi:hypothetical protein
MTQDQTKKEALFNEVKGSLFEYLVAKRLSILNQAELDFHQSLDKNYLNVLSQQDRMVRQFYPEMLPFLETVSTATVAALLDYLQELPCRPRLLGKFVNAPLRQDMHEADLLVTMASGPKPISLKLNKKNSYVNTKSGGIKSFLLQYFSFADPSVQAQFNQLVDLEFNRMALELHELHGLDYPGNFSIWVKHGLSELPGESAAAERVILKQYYARLAHELYHCLLQARQESPEQFAAALPALLGFSSPDILQVICFHDFKSGGPAQIELHSFMELAQELKEVRILPFQHTASVGIEIGKWTLQIRIKPMNKFTTTAIKINCSVKVAGED